MVTVNIAKKRIQEVWQVLLKAEKAAYIGEPISQLEHALQTADKAQERGGDDDLIIAALLHDIGHLIDPTADQMDHLGTKDHEKLGAAYLLKLGFSDRVVNLVGAHVDAKRYLCGANPAYLRKLSTASGATLDWQGGPMTPDECAAFEARSDYREILQLRAFDEYAKRSDYRSPNREHYRNMLLRHLVEQSIGTNHVHAE